MTKTYPKPLPGFEREATRKRREGAAAVGAPRTVAGKRLGRCPRCGVKVLGNFCRVCGKQPLV